MSCSNFLFTGIGSTNAAREPWAAQPFEQLPTTSTNFPGGTFDGFPMASDVPAVPAGFGTAPEAAASSQFPGPSYTDPQQTVSGWPMMPSTWWLRSGIGDEDEGVSQEANDDAVATYSVSDEGGQYGRDLDAYWVVPGVNAPPADSSQTAASANWEQPAAAQLPDAGQDYLPFDGYDYAPSLMPLSISIPSYPAPQVDGVGAREPATAMTGSPSLGDVVRLPIPGTATMVQRDPRRLGGAATTSGYDASSADEGFYVPPAVLEDQGSLPSPASSSNTAGDGLLSWQEQQGQRRSSQQPPASAPESYGTNIAIPRQGGGQELIPSAAYERSSGVRSGFLLG